MIRRGRLLLAAAACAAAQLGAAGAINPREWLDDPVLEARARAISRELRCVVCQNQSIDDSNAPLAGDMRILVRERIASGDSDAEVKVYLVDRYGDFVLLRPQMKPSTAFLWFGPALFLLAALLGFGAHLGGARRGAASPAPLSPDELRRLDELDSENAG